MKITICGSIAFYDELLKIQKELESLGHEVKNIISEIKGEKGEMISTKTYNEIRHSADNTKAWVWDRKEEAMKIHLNKVSWAEAILVVNYSKNNIENYIDGNVLLEMGLAFYLGKKIYLLNPIPEISYKEEILGMKPIIINNDLIRIS